MAPTVQQCLFSLEHVICTEAQQRHDHWRCYHGHGHLHSADAQHLCFLHQNGLLGIIADKLKWLELPLCSTTVVSADL